KGKGKGKGAEPDQDGAPKPSTTDGSNSGSLLPRLAQSAASLQSTLLSGPSSSGLGRGNEKGEPSRASETLARAGESSVQLRSNMARGETMRMGQTQEHIAREEASFAAFLDSDSVPTLSEPGGLEGAWQSAVPAAGVSSETRGPWPHLRSVAEQEADDGAEVIALLSGDPALDPVFEHVNEPASESDLAGLRRALFGDEADHDTSAIAWDSVLNFIPEYLHPHTATGIPPGGDLSMHLGITDADEGWQTWLNQWSRVLTSYQDEVWGDLGALVEEARVEVQRIAEAEPGEKPPEPKSLLRLRAILGHLRG
ncbi:hypothetical protein BT67DRAFT_353486, partial [Trichocladium antarcticum]